MKPDVRQRAVALVVRVLLELFQGPPSPLTTTLKAGGSPVAFRGRVDVPFRVRLRPPFTQASLPFW